MADTPPPIEQWLENLSRTLTIAGRGYLSCSIDEADAERHPSHPEIWRDRTAFALLAVGTIHNALAELLGPDHVGLVPTHGLVNALRDLGRGSKPALLEPRPGIGDAADTFDRRAVKLHAILCIDVLCSAGLKVKDATQEVAAALAATGHRGRKGKLSNPAPLSQKTIAGWREEAQRPDYKAKDVAGYKFLERNLARYRARPDRPLSAAEAKALVRKLLVSSIMQSKADYPHT